MKRRLLFTILLVISMSLLLVACNQGAEQPAATDEPDTEEPTDGEEPEEPTDGEEPEEPTDGEAQPIYLMGADGLLSDTYFANIGEAGLGMYFSGPAAPEGGAYEEFVAKYAEAYGENPIQSFHAHAYDSANMAFNAIEQVAEVADDGTVTINRVALIEAVYQMEHSGLTGNLACNEFGDCASPAIGIFRFEDASWGAAEVLANIVNRSTYDLPNTGIGVVPEAPEDFGDVVIEPGAPIEIATLQAISGAVANLGTDQVRAVEIAIADRGGELLGHPLELSMSEDDLCSSEGGQTGAQRIIANPQIVAVIGTSCSGAGVPASEALSAEGILMISGSNTAPALTATGYFTEEGPQRGEAWSYGYFRVSHNDEFQGRAAADFAYNTLGIRQAATINDGDPYTQGLTTAFGASFEEFGGEIVLATAVGVAQEDMRSTLTEVAASGAELVFFPIFEPAGDFIVLQVPDVNLSVIRD